MPPQPEKSGILHAKGHKANIVFYNPKAQNGPKALYSMVFGPKSLNI